MVRAAVILIILLGSSVAHAEKRVALVIGNGAYTRVPKLDNPKNDAAAVEGMLKAAAFDTVVLANDLGIVAMRRALRDFSDTAHDADVAVVFYAGHGMEVSGTNYLIPTDAVLERDIDAHDEAVSLDRVNEMMESVKRLRLVILDACRDNPFVRSMRRTLATRAVRSGYGEIDEKSLPPNTLVAYAQRAGATAEDGFGTHSPYTTAILKHLPTPGLDIELALRRVRDEVLKSTGNRQEPFKYGSVGGAEIALVPTTAPQPVPATSQRLAIDYDKEMEITFWNAVKDTKSVDLLKTYLDRYPTGNFSGLAKALIDQLARHQLATEAGHPSTSVVAALPLEAQAPPVEKPSTDTIADRAKLARALQTELKRVGCDPGAVDGQWSTKAKDALREFSKSAHVTLTIDIPTEEALRAIATRNGSVCALTCGANKELQNGRCVAKPNQRARQKVVGKPIEPQKKDGDAHKKGICINVTGGGLGPCTGRPGEQRYN